MVRKHTISLDDDTYAKAMAAYRLHNFSGVSELIDTAVKEWLAREAGQVASSLLSSQLVSIVEETIRLSEQRINGFLFRLAVGDAELKYVLAEASGYTPEQMKGIHDHCEREVRLTNGLLNLEKYVQDAYEEKQRKKKLASASEENGGHEWLG